MTTTSTTTHSHKVTADPFDSDLFAAACSCGWGDFDPFETRTAANGAVDRHIASVIA